MFAGFLPTKLGLMEGNLLSEDPPFCDEMDECLFYKPVDFDEEIILS